MSLRKSIETFRALTPFPLLLRCDGILISCPTMGLLRPSPFVNASIYHLLGALPILIGHVIISLQILGNLYFTLCRLPSTTDNSESRPYISSHFRFHQP